MLTTVPEQQKKKGGLGCLGIGCLTCVVIFFVVIGAVGFFLVSSIRNAVDSYTTVDRPAFTVAGPSGDWVTAGRARYSELAELLRNPTSSGTVTFSGEELSGAVASVLGDLAAVTILGNELDAKFSFQLRSLFGSTNSGVQLLLGSRLDRFASGEARGSFLFKPSNGGVQDDSGLLVTLTRLELNGRAVEDQALIQASSWFSQALTGLLSGTDEAKPDEKPLIARISALELKDGSLTVSLRPAP